jgi:hypothetical protein
MELEEAQAIAMKAALENGHAMHPWRESDNPTVRNSISGCVFCKQHAYITEAGISGAVLDNRCKRAWYFTEFRG